MTEDDQLWTLLAAIEERLPLDPKTLEALFATRFAKGRDHDRSPILVATTSRHELELRTATGTSEGNLTVRCTPPLNVSVSSIYQRYPGGHSVPPPPPGYGPADAAGAYIAECPWGQIWFTLLSGDRLLQISIGPGMRGAPGV